MEGSDMEHRKFLKTPNLTYELGAFLPEQVELNYKDFIDLSWLSQTEYGGGLFFLSSYCKACNSEAVIEVIRKYPEFSYTIFYEGSDTTVSGHEKLLNERDVKMYSFEMHLLEKNLKVFLLPFLLVLNKVGQVISSGIINNVTMIEALMLPLVRSVENRQ